MEKWNLELPRLSSEVEFLFFETPLEISRGYLKLKDRFRKIFLMTASLSYMEGTYVLGTTVY